MKLSEWFKAKNTSSNPTRLSDSAACSGKSIGDSEKLKFKELWSDKSVLSAWSLKKIKRL